MTEEPPSPLLIDHARLIGLLGPDAGRFSVDVLAECASTNSFLLERAAAGAPSGSVVVADRQTAGRGSRGRSWLATPDASLTFYGDCKLGGILVEVQSDPESAQAVIGIGLNLRRPPDFVAGPQALAPVALEDIVPQLPERNALLAALLHALAGVFDAFADGGFAVLRSRWQTYHAWQERPVNMLRDGKVEVEGACLGADEDGALLVRTATGLERCLSGDLTLRPGAC